jgi:protein tyrosine/serine phosphatase
MKLPKFSRRKLLLSAMAVGATSVLPDVSCAKSQRPRNWAVPLELDGVPNFHRISPLLYRGAQPNTAGFRNLEHDYHIRTVLNLRKRGSDTDIAVNSKMHFVRAPMNPFHVTDDREEQIVKALRLINIGTEHGRVFVHCTHGADRTGLIIVLWRMLNQGWSREAAIDEMENGGYNYHRIFFNIPHYLENVDVAELKRRVMA